MKHRYWMFVLLVAACAEPEPESIEDAADAPDDAEDYRAPDGARAESGPLTECPVDTALVDGWCIPQLQVPDVVTITVPRYRNGAEPPVIDKDRSLLVVDRTRFAAVQGTFTVGKLLTDRNAFMNAYVVNHDLNDGEITGGRVHTRRSGTFNPFEGGREQVDDHNAHADAFQLGSMVEIRNTWSERVLGPVPFGGTGPWEDTGDPHELSDPNGPFRLLAVVNRMDLAGDTDGRGEGPDGASLAEDQRKWFGEGRLVFGLTNGGTGAYPMTFILEYRLPALRVVAQNETSTKFAVDPACGPGVSTDCYDHTAGPFDNAAWLAGRAHWARVWRELSAIDNLTEYNQRLHDIVRLFARPENLIAMRTGERVRDAASAPDQSGLVEFEYREFYSNGGFGLARRHNRREALFCAGGSALLKDVVLEEYDDALETPAYDYKLGDQTFDVSDPGDREVQLKALCGETRFGSPDGDGGMSLRPAFARFTPDQRWPAFPLWNARRGDNDDAATNEAYRHTTALNSCSGCHAAETGTTGFHIAPRTANANSAVSPFLDGTDHTITITIHGVDYDYTYNELARRRALLEAFYDRDDVGHAPGTPTGHEGLLKALLRCTTSPCGGG